MNLSANHCKLLQRVWRELRHDKLRQIERPVLWSSLNPDHSPLSTSSSLGVVCVWNDPMQQDLYQIVLSFVDKSISELKSRRFRQRLGEHCRKFGRQMAMVFRGTSADVDQSLSWEMLGQAIVENLSSSGGTTTTIPSLRGSAATARLFVWQIFLENLSTLVFEAFCWSVARDYTSTPLATIYEDDDPKLAENRSPWTTKTPNDETPSRMGREPPVWEPRHHSTVPTQPSPAALSAQSTGPSTAPAPFVPRNAETYRAIYSYYELALQEDDIVLVVERCDDGWFIGTLLRTGEFGTFPGNYVVKH
ncbi:variant SH3 domain-containing protein [Ditylenchus destructor]|uniref:Variant SH3 domain-containing protein n=1 Tax=Ditylenchus destructor TaxID=166010 RepID=A0AAD4MFD6_9BILA|nr:variant SH3 domain-containing protein [Ditylenchus destructor]